MARQSERETMTFDYVAVQLGLFNPGLGRIAERLRTLVPRSARELLLPLPIGEMLVSARPRGEPPA